MNKFNCIAVFSLILMCSGSVMAQKHEIGFLVGGTRTGQQNFQLPTIGNFETGTGFTYEVTYARRIVDGEVASLHFEIVFALAPKTKVNSAFIFLPRDYSSLFLTPGIKFKLFPGFFLSPFVTGGIGYARFSTSDVLINNLPNTGDRISNKPVYHYGGGIELRILPFFSLRGEIRDFVSGTPAFRTIPLKDRQHNVMVTAGGMIRF